VHIAQVHTTQTFNLTNRPCWMHFPDWLPQRSSENDGSV